MGTTVELDDDVARPVEQLQHDEGLGVSEAVDELIGGGLTARSSRPPFVQQTRSMGMEVDVSHVAQAVATVEGDESR